MDFRKPAWLTRRLVLLGFVLLILAVSAMASHFIKITNIADAQSAPFIELALPLYPFFLTALAFFGVLWIREILSFFVSREEDLPDPVPSRGELGLLLKLKRRGSFLRRSWLIRKLASRTSQHAPGISAQIERRAPQSRRPEKALDRLLRLKQVGAWNPQYPGEDR